VEDDEDDEDEAGEAGEEEAGNDDDDDYDGGGIFPPIPPSAFPMFFAAIGDGAMAPPPFGYMQTHYDGEAAGYTLDLSRAFWPPLHPSAPPPPPPHAPVASLPADTE